MLKACFGIHSKVCLYLITYLGYYLILSQFGLLYCRNQFYHSFKIWLMVQSKFVLWLVINLQLRVQISVLFVCVEYFIWSPPFAQRRDWTKQNHLLVQSLVYNSLRILFIVPFLPIWKMSYFSQQCRFEARIGIFLKIKRQPSWLLF